MTSARGKTKKSYVCNECGQGAANAKYRDVLIRHLRVIHAITSRPRPKGRPKKSAPETREPISEVAAVVPEDNNDDQNASRNDDPLEDTVGTGPLFTTGTSQPTASRQPATSFQHGMNVGNTWPMTGNGSDTTLMNNAPVSTDGISLFARGPPVNSGLLSMDYELYQFASTSRRHIDLESMARFCRTTPPRISQASDILNVPFMPTGPVYTAPDPTNVQAVPGESLPTPLICQATDPAPLEEVADPVPVERDVDSNPWPFEWHATKDDQKIVLPELRSTDSQRARNSTQLTGSDTTQRDLQFFGAKDTLDVAKRADIIQLLSLPLTRIPWQEDVSILGNLPSPDILHHLIDLYFLHFHELWPIIHQPTFNVSKVPTIQILSMACIGACYSGLDSSLDFADNLAELCRRTSSWMAERDPRFLRSPSYGISLLLQHIHAIGSGSRRLFEMTDSSRSRLVSIGRHMNLFSAGLHASRPESSTRTGDRYDNWLEWIKREQIKRLIWFIFEFDCFYTAFSKQPPCIKFEELPSDSTCEELHWDAPTAYAWASCPYQAPPRGLPTMQTLRALLSRDADIVFSLKPFDHLSKRLLLRCLGRCLESIQEQMESGVYNVLWEDSAGRAVMAATRARISMSVMSVYQSSWEEISQGTSLRVALRIAIAAHYSHIFAAGRLTGLTTRVARKRAGEYNATRVLPNPANSGRTTPHDDEFIKAAFCEDPRSIRELMWHASQVIYLQRRHPFNTPHEPLSVFLAGLSLWAFLKYFDPESGDAQSGISVQLDEPSFCSPPEARQAIKDWIEKGGKTYLEGVGDVRSPDAPKRILTLCVNMTRRLQVWKMASKVSEIFARLLQREDQDYAESVSLDANVT
ncbi:hypothetical protein EDD36DRAFT_417971 [Exophiala viscosa]|uniref:Xylanolytic transcriptional activator regulatory domain-containing protein n=1 Tax=Exophiala viscosa TaxID=2486360 RepID=A0AAN6IG38_9EURO|nr:hypothetical protein EDD36DRAFT_417971 [Exophiala viscosa]